MQIVTDIQQILRHAQQYALRSINKAMLNAYWQVGRRIVEEEQLGESRAAYGKGLMKNLSAELQKEFGKGFSVRNIEQMRLFYLKYPIPQTVSAELPSEATSDTASLILDTDSTIPQKASAELPISETVSRKLQTPDFQLSWSHYLLLIRIENKEERAFYEIEAAKNQWSLRELKRQFDSALYLRLALSTDKEGIRMLAEKGQIFETLKDAVKDPYILEFLDLPEHYRYSENDLEISL